MTDAELVQLVNKLRGVMIAVSTGGPRIESVNGQFQNDFQELESELSKRKIENTIPYRDLWQWYGKWSSDIPGYANRRVHIAEVCDPLVGKIRNRSVSSIEPTGWDRVDRVIIQAQDQLQGAKDEEHFQMVGLLCREALISLAQHVFVAEKHPVSPEIRVSPTDFKRMIEAYISVEMAGGAAEELRKHSRTALDLALRLQHQRTARFRDAAICIEATSALINIIAIVSGRRDPE